MDAEVVALEGILEDARNRQRLDATVLLATSLADRAIARSATWIEDALQFSH